MMLQGKAFLPDGTGEEGGWGRGGGETGLGKIGQGKRGRGKRGLGRTGGDTRQPHSAPLVRRHAREEKTTQPQIPKTINFGGAGSQGAWGPPNHHFQSPCQAVAPEISWGRMRTAVLMRIRARQVPVGARGLDVLRSPLPLA